MLSYGPIYPLNGVNAIVLSVFGGGYSWIDSNKTKINRKEYYINNVNF